MEPAHRPAVVLHVGNAAKPAHAATTHARDAALASLYHLAPKAVRAAHAVRIDCDALARSVIDARP